MSNIVFNLAHDETLASQAMANTPQQFSESPALPKAFMGAVLSVNDNTPQIIVDIFNDEALFAELSRALPAMLYEHLPARS